MGLVYVTRKIPTIGVTMLEAAGHEVVINETDEALSAEALIAAIEERPYNALLTLLSDTVNGALLDHAPEVTIVSNYAVGFNNIDVAELTKRQVLVTNTPDVLNDSVAEFTIALILAVAKRIAEADRFTRAGKYRGWAPELFLGSDLKDKTLGIVGAGRIGSSVAHIAKTGLGMNVEYYDVEPCESLEVAIPCRFVPQLEDLLRSADVVTLHVPLLAATRHLMNAERFAQMKSTAYFINTARGPVVDEVALVSALKAGTIAGAGLDVFEFEPAITEELKAMEQVTLTPHIASASRQTRDEMAVMAAQAIIDHLAGKQPAHVVTV